MTTKKWDDYPDAEPPKAKSWDDYPDAEPEPVKMSEPSTKEQALTYGLAALSSGAQGSIPALSGALAAGRRLFAPASLPREQARESITDAYRRARDDAAKTVEPAEKVGGLPAAIVGQVPSMFASAPSAAGRIAVNSLTGLAQSGFRSGGDIGEMAKGAAISAGLSGTGELAGAGLGKLSGWATGKAGQAHEAVLAARQRALEKTRNSARGALGGETSTGARTLEQAKAAVIDVDVDPEIRKQALDFLMSDEAKALRNQVLESSVERGSGQLERIQSAKDVFIEASQDIPGKAAAQAEAISRPGAVMSDVAGRFGRSVGQRAALAIGGGAVGELVGGERGGVFGAGMGFIAPGALQTMRNVSKLPQVHENLWRAGSAVGSAASKAASSGAGLMSRTPKPSGNKKQDDEDAVNAYNSSGQ